MSEVPGSNSEAYFVGKRQLLGWVNEFLELELKKVEELHTGWAYCQLVDAIFPGQVKISKVDFHAKFDYEYLKNFKVMQDVFTKNQVKKPVPMDKLIKGKYQDNFEFLQWFKSFFDARYNGEPYNAEGRRAKMMKKKVLNTPTRLNAPGGRRDSKSKSSDFQSSPKPNVKLFKKTPSRLLSHFSGSSYTGKPRDTPTNRRQSQTKMKPPTPSKNGGRKTDTTAQDLDEKLKAMTWEKEAAIADLQKLQERLTTMIDPMILEEKEKELEEMKSVNDYLEKQVQTEQNSLLMVKQRLMQTESALQKKKEDLKDLKDTEDSLKEKLSMLEKEFNDKEKEFSTVKKSLITKREEVMKILEETKEQLTDAKESLLAISSLSWWAVSSEKPDVEGLKILKLALVHIDSKHMQNDDTHIVASVANADGMILGKSCRSTSGAIHSPMYIIVGEKNKNEASTWLFVQVKHAKKKKTGLKMSDIGFGCIELDPYIDSWLLKSSENPAALKFYKKSADFSRDPGSLKPMGKEVLKIAFQLLKAGNEEKKNT